MASAQLLKVTNTIDNKVAGVDDRVKDVDDKVNTFDDKLVVVIAGAQYIFNQSSEIVLTPNASRWKGGQGVTADDVDRVKRS
jgi:hypothetical protein